MKAEETGGLDQHIPVARQITGTRPHQHVGDSDQNNTEYQIVFTFSL